MENFKDAIYKIIGSRIKNRRIELNLSQIDLSNKLKLGRSTISNIEIGRHQVTLTTIYELSDLLNISIYDLLPSYDVILKTLHSDVKIYTKILDSKDLDKNQKESVAEIIKNL